MPNIKLERNLKFYKKQLDTGPISYYLISGIFFALFVGSLVLLTDDRGQSIMTVLKIYSTYFVGGIFWGILMQSYFRFQYKRLLRKKDNSSSKSIGNQ